MSENKLKLEKNAAIVLSLGVAICVAIITFSTLSAKESALLSLLLTVLSVLASWLFSSIHSSSQHAEAINEVKEMHNDNLRTYALKAAEKVNNLSEQLNRLSLYLEDELSDDSIPCERAVRVVSAIHMIAMLKSVNDTSLSDWQGVIGEEIEEHRKENEEQKKQLLSLIEKVDHLWESYDDDSLSVDAVDKRVNQLKREVSNLAANITGSHINVTRNPKSAERERIKTQCPACNGDIEYSQRGKKGSAKPISCKHCRTKLVSNYDDEHSKFRLVVAELKNETFHCPTCEASTSCKVDTRLNKRATLDCSSCNTKLVVVRKGSGQLNINGHRTLPTQEINDEFIELVRKELPQQPWEKHIHKTVARKLDVTNTAVQKAIDKLIATGVFKEQKDGVLFDLVKIKESA
ncbi:TPA: hypothetical protein ACF311_004614 [Vibrio parahaemolyticus]|uniref:hypothetical protein n=1 Tax=Vibrio parahaemolyticus TaxID=670 RepID=UPI00226AAEE9|nr:hypothetical protein [Vibrio parahaemolyticus]MCX8860057.1 hypothetical protein [Vibrio parahaemolyticus]MCX8865268.1 hypothetical protein [Vibrio parahaemolyticus]MCX8870355.1 hypothetical protein [Vibrio parahaemolyticus]MCX8900573.1 hypothetical protein [Vibrio parahaemolyticus]MCX8920895.1 hypothetical protein [Vibrio parahaemolyticus]